MTMAGSRMRCRTHLQCGLHGWRWAGHSSTRDVSVWLGYDGDERRR